MGRELTEFKRKLRDALKEEGTYRRAMEFRIEIAAGAGMLHKKLLDDIERLSSPVIRYDEDLDFAPGPDEAVKLLDKAAKNYHNALVALGLADNFINDAPRGPGRPPKDIPVNDADALNQLIQKTVGDDSGA